MSHVFHTIMIRITRNQDHPDELLGTSVEASSKTRAMTARASFPHRANEFCAHFFIPQANMHPATRGRAPVDDTNKRHQHADICGMSSSP